MQKHRCVSNKGQQGKTDNNYNHDNVCLRTEHYENTPIQIYRKFQLQKLKIFR